MSISITVHYGQIPKFTQQPTPIYVIVNNPNLKNLYSSIYWLFAFISEQEKNFKGKINEGKKRYPLVVQRQSAEEIEKSHQF